MAAFLLIPRTTSLWTRQISFGFSKRLFSCQLIKLGAALMTCLIMLPESSRAQSGSLLSDVNGDGQIQVLAFGDSITYGIGDGNSPGSYVESIDSTNNTPSGYPQRVSAATGLTVSNAGVPGERLLTEGLYRLAGLLTNSDIDVAIVMEGTNDAIHRVEENEYRLAMQKIINVARAEEKILVINTLAPPTGLRSSLAPYTNLYSGIIRNLCAINSIPFADIEQKFLESCPDLTSCNLYNIPEGLHPNTVGYNAVAEVVQAKLGGAND